MTNDSSLADGSAADQVGINVGLPRHLAVFLVALYETCDDYKLIVLHFLVVDNVADDVTQTHVVKHNTTLHNTTQHNSFRMNTWQKRDHLFTA